MTFLENRIAFFAESPKYTLEWTHQNATRRNLQEKIEASLDPDVTKVQNIVNTNGINMNDFPIQFQKQIHGIPYTLVRQRGEKKTFAIDGNSRVVGT